MKRIIPLAAFLVLSAMVAVLFGFTVYEAWNIHRLGGIVTGVIMFGVLTEIVVEIRRIPSMQAEKTVRRESALTALAVVGGALVTYTLSCSLGLGAVTSSGLVGLVAALIAPAYAVPAYCGSFVGMTSIQLLGTHGELTLAAAVAALIYVLTEGTYPGIGGKLGTIAFVGAVITGLGLERSFIVSPIPEQRVVILIIICSVVATLITYWLNVTRGHGGVIASGVVGLAGGLILPAIDGEIGTLLAVVAICASFAGMSSQKAFPHYLMIIVIGLITGLIFVYSTPLLGGAGGKLGTIAFGAGLAVRGYLDLPKAFAVRSTENASERQSTQQMRGS